MDPFDFNVCFCQALKRSSGHFENKRDSNKISMTQSMVSKIAHMMQDYATGDSFIQRLMAFMHTTMQDLDFFSRATLRNAPLLLSVLA